MQRKILNLFSSTLMGMCKKTFIPIPFHFYFAIPIPIPWTKLTQFHSNGISTGPMWLLKIPVSCSPLRIKTLNLWNKSHLKNHSDIRESPALPLQHCPSKSKLVKFQYLLLSLVFLSLYCNPLANIIFVLGMIYELWTTNYLHTCCESRLTAVGRSRCMVPLLMCQ